jgi:predicted CXXCH cytochrome family protein
MRWLPLIVLSSVIMVVAIAGPAYALDPPHDFANCKDCHQPHNAPGGAITIQSGNANLCLSCHEPDINPAVGQDRELAEGDQAVAGPGLPTGINPSGTSHRWDSGVAGWAEADGSNTSTGDVESGGAYTGDYAKTYTITITAQGDVGPSTTFSWTDTVGGSGSGTAQAGVALNEGVNVTFTDGTSPSFVLGDIWRVYVRPDIRTPTNAALAARIDNGKIMCSTCHNQHVQDAAPFDPNAPGSGDGRHFQRLDNTTNQMCKDCHNARDVGVLSGQGTNQSHPVGLAHSAWSGLFETRAQITLPLDKGADATANNADDRIQCMSCHYIHDPVGAPTTDGTLLRVANHTTLCTDCHTLADTASGSHFDTSTGVLWPGGQYSVCAGGANANQTCDTDSDCPSSTCGAESTFPQVATGRKGYCTNCHQPHGWPDATNTTQDYATLLVDKDENLCYTCHDGTVTTTADVYSQFNGATNFQDDIFNQRHDVSDADQTFSGGVVECANCHNPHRLTDTNKLIDPDNPSQPFTATYSKNNSYGGNNYRSADTDLDPVNPEGKPTSTRGPAVADSGNTGNETATSGGTYSGTEDLTYEVEVTTAGAPGTAQITASVIAGTGDCSGGNPCNPTTVNAFNSPVAVGNFNVTISFDDPDVSPGAVSSATKITSIGPDTATSNAGPNYTGSETQTYTVTVSRGGAPGTGVSVTDVCTGSGASGATCEADGAGDVHG